MNSQKITSKSIPALEMKEFLVKPVFKMMPSFRSYQNCSATCSDIGWGIIGVSLILRRPGDRDQFLFKAYEISLLKKIFKPSYESFFDQAMSIIKYGDDEKISEIFNDLIENDSKSSFIRFGVDPVSLKRKAEYEVNTITYPSFYRFHVAASMNDNDLSKLFLF